MVRSGSAIVSCNERPDNKAASGILGVTSSACVNNDSNKLKSGSVKKLCPELAARTGSIISLPVRSGMALSKTRILVLL